MEVALRSIEVSRGNSLEEPPREREFHARTVPDGLRESTLGGSPPTSCCLVDRLSTYKGQNALSASAKECRAIPDSRESCAGASVCASASGHVEPSIPSESPKWFVYLPRPPGSTRGIPECTQAR